MIVDVETAKTAARALRTDLAARRLDLTHSAARELVAHQLGHRDWNTASALLARSPGAARLRAPVPVLRVLDGVVGRESYGSLGFELLWEHRFEPDLPLYQRLRRDEVVLDPRASGRTTCASASPPSGAGAAARGTSPPSRRRSGRPRRAW